MEDDRRHSKIGKRVSLGVGGALVELSAERIGWSHPIEFVLSCIGYAVGIGNVWRFPYLVYRNGGGAFLIPFVLMLITMGLPIFFLELVIGQYSNVGPTSAFGRMAPAFQGLGYCTVVVMTLVNIYYMVIVAWTLFYMFASFSTKLMWAYCDNDFNTDECYSGLQDMDCQKNDSSTIFYKKSCMSISTVCSSFGFNGGNVTHCFNGENATALRHLYKRVLSSEQYFSDYVLGIRGAKWDNWGGIRWELLACLTLAWIICFFCLIKGVQSVGKIVYFTALFPYFVLLALLIRGVTLEGSMEGNLWYITPVWTSLLDARMWGDAASQIFYSLGIGCGSLVTLSSYSTFTNNCHRDAIFVSLANLLTSVFAGFAIFSIMGFLAQQMNIPISEVVQSDTGLAFIAYPEAVVRMPLPNLWAILFFFMLFILGLGSQFAGIQTISTVILDLRPNLRKYETYVILGICATCWLLAIPMVFNGGIYLFTLMDWNTASWAILLIGFAEVVLASWFYGCNKFLHNITEMQMNFGCLLYSYWRLSWIVLAPITALGVFGYQMYTYRLPSYGDYEFPEWAGVLGVLIGVSTLAPLPIFFIYQLCVKKRGWSLLKPTSLWGPLALNVLNNDKGPTLVVDFASHQNAKS
ncbi:sodium- and chloride-dependent glycine transporter 1-like [Leptopilina boulardi]|uniref:sodium- and chloride-dependent glycine transporter 1-like n=1 Tax=Leptopilina boulardi TaxID=63433 RepID=UPI0021F5BC01|nr:sodium- and chloride-dependent glycine transporter 1-like [Leptopilina boulardi]XP_051158296.1 sodium- and chloride-dependent glycine transporter 1-like [Leptopilina boulardi]